MKALFPNNGLSAITNSRYRFALLLMLTMTGLYPVSGMTGELHQHIEVKVIAERIEASFCRPEKGCSLVPPETLGLPAGQMPVDQVSGIPIYVTEFVQFPDRVAIDSPGFEGLEGDLIPGDLVRYIASGHLSYWSPEQQQWTLAPPDVKIRLAGGLEIEPNQACGQVICFPVTSEGFTLFSRDGISGAASLIVGEVGNDGSLHTHLDWIIETGQAATEAPVGAYMVELRLMSDAYATPSEILWIMFNQGLALSDFQQAVGRRVLQPNTDTELADRLYQWAEVTYPSLFPHATSSFTALGYYARCYNNGVCVGIKDNHVFAIGGEFGSNIVNIGEFDHIVGLAGF